MNNVVRIEREDDLHTTSNKWADFSTGSIKKMIADGYQQALDQLKQLQYKIRFKGESLLKIMWYRTLIQYHYIGFLASLTMNI